MWFIELEPKSTSITNGIDVKHTIQSTFALIYEAHKMQGGRN